jgi:hypothetical protein
MKLYDAGFFIIASVLGLLLASYGTFSPQPAPCKVWFTERTPDGREKSYCADGE